MEDYKAYLLEYCIEHPGQRFGQACFNALYKFKPDCAEEVRGLDIDTFYTKDSDVIDAFFEFVEKYLGENT